MIDDEKRAKWLATWASMGLEAADYLRDRGHALDADNLTWTAPSARWQTSDGLY